MNRAHLLLHDVSSLIGSTPLVGLTKFSPNPKVKIWAKLEGQNPTGSVKDRVAKAMIDAASRSGEMRAGRELLEPTSGNTGISLAFFASRMGLPLTCVMPDTASRERSEMIEMFGARVVYSPGDKGSNGAIEMAREMAQDPKYLMLYQYGNDANPRVHYETTGPEIYEVLPEVSHFVAGLGTGGTLTGVGRYLKERDPQIQIIAAEPLQGELVYGLRSLEDGFVPPVFDPEILDGKIMVSASDSVRLTRDLAVKEGIFAGISSGATVHVAVRLAERIEEGNIVCLFADGGWKYLSTGLWTKQLDEAAQDVEYMPW